MQSEPHAIYRCLGERCWCHQGRLGREIAESGWYMSSVITQRPLVERQALEFLIVLRHLEEQFAQGGRVGPLNLLRPAGSYCSVCASSSMGTNRHRSSDGVSVLRKIIPTRGVVVRSWSLAAPVGQQSWGQPPLLFFSHAARDLLVQRATGHFLDAFACSPASLGSGKIS